MSEVKARCRTNLTYIILRHGVVYFNLEKWSFRLEAMLINVFSRAEI